MFKIKSFAKIKKLFWPIALTMLLTNTLAFVDTIMISNYNIIGVSAITTATQIQFIFGPIYFAILMGVNVYTVQYYARKDYSLLKKLSGIALTLLICLVSINFIIILLFEPYLINFFVDKNSEIGKLAFDYMYFFKFSLLLMPIDMFFSYQYRAIKKPKIPLVIGTTQSLLNIIFNFFLIYGIGIFPELGISGAAISTLFSRTIVICIHILVAKKINAPFIGKLKDMFSYNKELFKEVFFNTLPLMVVELGFGLSNVIYLKIYSMTSIIEFTAYNIVKSISFLINAFVIATANVSGIIAGSTIAVLEESNKEELKEQMKDLFKFMGLNSIIILFISFLILPLLIPIFTKDIEYYSYMRKLLMINGIWMAIRVFSSSIIAILKSGNDNKFVMLVDAGSAYLFGIPITLIVYFIFTPSIIVLRSMIILEVICKFSLGMYRYNKKKWVRKV